MRAFTEELVQQAFVDAYDKAKDSDEMTKIAKLFAKMYDFDIDDNEISGAYNAVQQSDINLNFESDNLIEIKKLLNGEYTIEIGGNDVALINYLKFRIGRKDIGILKK